MFDTPDLMRMAQELARYSGTRQALIAKNIANADTPGYRAMDLPSFAERFARTGDMGLRQTREGHQASDTAPRAWAPVEVTGTASPNGNTVSLEEEMVRSTRAASDHTLALTVYRSSLDMMRSALGRGR